jgi:membrane-anchored mycosin MYCP
MAAEEGHRCVAYVRFPMGGICLSTQAARRSRIAIALLGAAVGTAALATVAQGPATAAATRSAAARSPRAPGAAKPSPKPSPKPTKPVKPTKPTTRSSSSSSSVPTPVAVEPQPNSTCPADNPLPLVTSTPWPQSSLDFSGAWPLTEGKGITVAVVDSGVDYNIQLAGKVKAIDLTGTGPQDCQSHGTIVAGIIAATDMQAQGRPFEGVAPDVNILSVKVQNQETGSTTVVAQGIRDAALLGAKVINVSITTSVNTPTMRSAVDFALHNKDAVVVAAGGNDSPGTGQGPFYPASYPGVLSVGAVAEDGSLGQFSDLRSHVGVTAPGVDVTSTVPGGYTTSAQGTSFATAFVSGEAALVRARYPNLNAAAVVARIEDTANGAAGPGTGDGLINPPQAVSAIPASTASASPSPSARPQSVAVFRAPPRNVPAIDTSMAVTAGAVGGAALVAIGAIVVTQGRRRRWRAGTMTFPAEGQAADDPWS